MVDVTKALQGGALSPEVKPNELVLKLMGDHPSEVLPFPRIGKDGEPLFRYRMCVLSQFELDGCLIDAERYTVEKFKTGKRPTSEELGAVRADGWTEVYSNAKIVEVLLRACRQPDSKTGAGGKVYYDPLFIGGDQIRKLLTTDELASLFSAYQNVQFRYGMTWRMLDDDEINAIVEKLGEGLNAYPLSHLEPGQLMVLVASLAAQNRALRQDTGSSGSPAESGTDETSASGEE